MKTVLKQLPEQNVTLVENVNSSKYYGVREKFEPYNKGFIARERYERGNFVIRCIDGLTNGNQWSKLNDNGFETLEDVIEWLLKGIPFEVYEFDTAQELMRWLAED